MTRKILGKLLEEATEVRGKRSEDRFEKKKIGCVGDRIEIAKKKRVSGSFGEEIILEKDRRTKRREELCS